MKIAAVLLFSLMLVVCTAPAQEKAQANPETPAAKAGDVDSIDHILAAVYDSISGPAGQRGDWGRFRSLFFPGARLISVSSAEQGSFAARVLTVEEFVTRARANSPNLGFFEREAARHVDQFGQIAQVFSTYESRRASGGEPFARGINSFQLMNDGRRWWVVTIYWEAERPENPIPEKYLVSGSK